MHSLPSAPSAKALGKRKMTAEQVHRYNSKAFKAKLDSDEEGAVEHREPPPQPQREEEGVVAETIDSQVVEERAPVVSYTGGIHEPVHLSQIRQAWADDFHALLFGSDEQTVRLVDDSSNSDAASNVARTPVPLMGGTEVHDVLFG